MYQISQQAVGRKASYVILTVRKHVYDRCKNQLGKYKLFDEENVLELCSKGISCLSRSDY